MGPIAPAKRRGSTWAVLGVLAVMGLLAVGGGAGLLIWMKGRGMGPFATAAAAEAEGSGYDAVPAALPGELTAASQGAPGPAASPAQADPAGDTVAPVPFDPYPSAPGTNPPPAAPPAAQVAAQESAAERTPERAAPGPKTTVPPRNDPPPAPRNTPARSTPATQGEAPAPPPSRPRPPEPAPAPVEPRSEPAAPRYEPAPAAPAATERFDQEMVSGLSLKFKVPSPDDVFLGIKQEGDRRFTSIGRAADFNADKRKLPSYDLPGPGTYYLRLYAGGREVIYRLQARSGPPTVITANIGPAKGRN
jgi:hypothetical protein